MPIIPIIMTLVVIGLILYLVNMLPIDATIKQIIHLIVIVLIILWLLQLLLGSGLGWPWRMCP